MKTIAASSLRPQQRVNWRSAGPGLIHNLARLQAKRSGRREHLFPCPSPKTSSTRKTDRFSAANAEARRELNQIASRRRRSSHCQQPLGWRGGRATSSTVSPCSYTTWCCVLSSSEFFAKRILGRNRIVQFADVMAKALSSSATGPHKGRHAQTVPENKQPLVLDAAVGVAKNVARICRF